ncbi:peptidylprolyl isomerase [Mycobacterium sp. 141]|uniref:peptidylprolyl isomerase n=1 Tax=Mycobacterium sp. 141 TaxID=1120797 RepID=UPI0003766FB4|nr:peptidylprolyl isomerase [Mycobacterium sp. 141]
MTIPPPEGGYQPGYPPPVGYPAPPPTNGLAIAALICGFLFAPLGIVFGHISLSQIRRTGEQGRGLAITGLVVGYLMTALALLAVVLVVVASLFTVGFLHDLKVPIDGSATPYPTAQPSVPPPPTGTSPSPATPSARANAGSNCQYPASDTPAKPVTPPRSGKVPTDPATVSASVTTNQGNIGLNLDNGRAPCTVNNFASLAQQGYFDDTPCHRLTTGGIYVLQCGDPTGEGTGGPGYTFADEYPVDQYPPGDPALQQPITYPRGTLAMANAGPGTNGSQFFLVYQDSQLPPNYTMFGTVDATGLATLDKIAAAGVSGGGQDGQPANPVTITSARLD